MSFEFKEFRHPSLHGRYCFALKPREISTAFSTLDHSLFSRRQYYSVKIVGNLLIFSIIVDLFREVIKFLQHV